MIYSWNERYATRLSATRGGWRIDSVLDGVFIIDRELRCITVYSQAAAPHAELSDVLSRRLLPRLVSSGGGISIHAAAVATRSSAFLLLGKSGAGKSTLTCALAATPGWDVLSDDLSLLWPGDRTIVAPGATGVCVWPMSQEGLNLDVAQCTPMPGYEGKVRFEPLTPPSLAPVELEAVIFLERDPDCERPALLDTDRGQSLIHAARQLTLFNPSAPPSAEYGPLFARFAGAVGKLPMLKLRYPSSYAAIPDVANLLSQLAR